MVSTHIRWDVHENLVIRDVDHKWYERVGKFMLEKHFKLNRLYNILEMPQEEGIDHHYLAYVRHVVQYDCSIIAVDEETKTIYAAVLLKWMTKEWKSWLEILLCVHASKWKVVLQLFFNMIWKYNMRNPQQSGESLHIFEFCIDEKLRSDDLFMEKFFNAIYLQAQHMKMDRLTIVALSKADQRIVKEFGFTHLMHVIFAIYKERDGSSPFAVLRENYEHLGWMFDTRVEPLLRFELLVYKPGMSLKKPLNMKRNKERGDYEPNPTLARFYYNE